MKKMKKVTLAVVLLLWATNALPQCVLNQQIPLQNMQSRYGYAPQKPLAEDYLLFSDIQVYLVEHNKGMPKTEHNSVVGMSAVAVPLPGSALQLLHYPCSTAPIGLYSISTDTWLDSFCAMNSRNIIADNKANKITFI